MLFYYTPNFIILNNLFVFKEKPLKGNQLFSAEKVELTVSLVKLITKRKLVLTNIHIKKPKADFSYLRLFLGENLEQIMNLIILSDRSQALGLAIDDALLVLPEGNDLSNYLIINSIFNAT